MKVLEISKNETENRNLRNKTIVLYMEDIWGAGIIRRDKDILPHLIFKQILSPFLGWNTSQTVNQLDKREASK